ncbi:MAG: phosphatase [Bacteroidia bacterium]
MRIAIIDLGTNTFNLLVADVRSNKTYTPVFQTKIAVKLGEGGISKGFIADAAFNRGIEALITYSKTIEEHNVAKVFAVATSAIRGASNGKAFVQKAHEKTGIAIDVISGEQEAETIYYGVRDAVVMNDTNSLIIDIGGGSTEFVIANKHTILWKQSFLLGVARLLELLKPSDPITDEEIERCENYLRKELQPLFDAVKQYPIQELIGSSGSFDSIAEMVAHKFYTPSLLDDKTEFEFNLEHCNVIHQMILKSTLHERLNMKGLVAMRVDMIVISSILVNFVLSEFSIKKMRLSTYSLKEGVLSQILNSLQVVT